jgi:tripartite-type tricarboxylate transporter receptor subunit TctC
MSPWIRHLLGLMLALAFATTASAQTASFPPVVRVIVPFAAGAGTDVLARAVVSQLGPRLGTNVIVENRPGAAGAIGVAAVAKGPRDGSMLLFHSTSLVTAAATARSVSFDVTKDLMPVAIVADGPMLVGVSAASGIRTPADWVAAARGRPQGLTAGSGGIGSVGHLAVELLSDAANVQVRHIPYRGAAPALTDVAAGTVDMLIASYSTIGPQVRSGRVVPIAVTSAQSSPSFPGLPTMASAAPGYETSIWYAMFAPTGTPGVLVQRLHREINDIARSGEVSRLVEADGALPVNAPPEELAARVRRDFEIWKKIATEKQILVD